MKKKLVSRENGYLEIKNETNIKTEMYYMLEKMIMLEEEVEKGKAAEKELSQLNKEFKELCQQILGECYYESNFKW